jgi:hypothetical protein
VAEKSEYTGCQHRDSNGRVDFKGSCAESNSAFGIVAREMMRADRYTDSAGRSERLWRSLNEAAYFRNTFITTGEE